MTGIKTQDVQPVLSTEEKKKLLELGDSRVDQYSERDIQGILSEAFNATKNPETKKLIRKLIQDAILGNNSKFQALSWYNTNTSETSDTKSWEIDSSEFHDFKTNLRDLVMRAARWELNNIHTSYTGDIRSEVMNIFLVCPEIRPLIERWENIEIVRSRAELIDSMKLIQRWIKYTFDITNKDKDGNTVISNTPLPEKYHNKAKKIESEANNKADAIIAKAKEDAAKIK